MEEMRTDVHWIEAVADWELFWTRHTVWQDYVSYSRRKTAKPRPQHEQWWELDTPDADQRKEKVAEVQKVGSPLITAAHLHLSLAYNACSCLLQAQGMDSQSQAQAFLQLQLCCKQLYVLILSGGSCGCRYSTLWQRECNRGLGVLRTPS